MIEQRIRELNIDINMLKEEWSKELDTVNYYYWPIIAEEKKKRKNLVWYFTLACCLLFSAVVWILFMEIKNEYWIAAALGGSGIIVGITAFRMILILKKLKRDTEEWNKNLKRSNELKQEIAEKSEKAISLMLDYLGSDVEEKIGRSYDDVLEYYNSFIESKE